MGSKKREEQQRLKTLLVDTVTLLCKSGLTYRNLRVQGLLGVTINDDDVFVVHLNEYHKDEGSRGEVSTSTDCQQSLSVNVNSVNSNSELHTTCKESPRRTRKRRPSCYTSGDPCAKVIKGDVTESDNTPSEDLIIIKSEPCDQTGTSSHVSQQADTSLYNETHSTTYGLDLHVGLSNLSSDFDNSQLSTDNDTIHASSPHASTTRVSSMQLHASSDPPYVTGLVCNAQNDIEVPISWITPVKDTCTKEGSPQWPDRGSPSVSTGGSTPKTVPTRVNAVQEATACHSDGASPTRGPKVYMTKKAKYAYHSLLKKGTLHAYDLSQAFPAPDNHHITNVLVVSLMSGEKVEESLARDACQRFFKNMKDELQRFRSGKKGKHMKLNKRNNRKKRKHIRRQECVELLPEGLQEKAKTLLSFKDLLSSEESGEDEEGKRYFTVLQQGYLSDEAQEIKNLLDKAYNDKTNVPSKNYHCLRSRATKVDPRSAKMPGELRLPPWMIKDGVD